MASFNKLLIPVTNHWFGGDQSSVAAFFTGGNPEPEARPTRMPADRWTFAQQVWLGFVATFPDSKRLLAKPGRSGYSPAVQRRRTVSQRLAELSLRYLQEEEALGRSPSLDEFGNAFPQRVSELGLDIKEAWATYTDVIHTVATTI